MPRRLYLFELADVHVDELTTVAIEEARSRFLADHAPSSANLWLEIVKLLMYYAVRRGMITAIPFRVSKLKVQRRPRARLSPSLAQKWIATIDEIDGRGSVSIAVRMMLGIGLREAETRTARWEWLDLDRGTYTPGVTKGREAVALPVPPWLLDHLRPLLKTQGLVIARPDGRLLPAQFTARAIRRANERTGTPGLTPHRLRGTYATAQAEAGVPVPEIKRVMRHKQDSTTLGYIEADPAFSVAGQQKMAETVRLRHAAWSTSHTESQPARW